MYLSEIVAFMEREHEVIFLTVDAQLTSLVYEMKMNKWCIKMVIETYKLAVIETYKYAKAFY